MDPDADEGVSKKAPVAGIALRIRGEDELKLMSTKRMDQTQNWLFTQVTREV